MPMELSRAINGVNVRALQLTSLPRKALNRLCQNHTARTLIIRILILTDIITIMPMALSWAA